MKNNMLIKAMALTVFAFLSCDKDDETALVDTQAEITQVTTLVTAGTWRITNFNESGSDQTSNFAGYGFSFNANGALTANNGSTTVTGTWSITDDSSNGDDDSSDDSGDDIDFNIFFATPAIFNDDLTEGWDIVSYSNTSISLIHISGGNGGTDTLVFEKK